MENESNFFVRRQPTRHGLIFVIMPFSGELQSVYEFVIKPFIGEIGMECLRADEIFSTRPIMQDIWQNIQRAEIVLADLTDRNPNVMYELGLCHALWKRTIIISQKIEDVPFDLKGYRLIPYEPSIGGAVRLKESLKQTIDALRREKRKEGQIVPYDQDDGPSLPRIEAVVVTVSQENLTLRLPDGRKAQMRREEFSWTHRLNDLSRRFKIGDKVDGVLLSETSTPITFSIRHKWPDPWPEFIMEFPIGKTFIGRVTNEDKPGLFVEIKKYFTGLIPRSILPRDESFQVDQQVEAAIKQIDPNTKSILLEYRGRTKDAWSEKITKYSMGGNYSGKVMYVQEKYLLVELEPGLQCIAHVINFPKSFGTQLKEQFPVGSEAKWAIKTIDKEKRQVQLTPVV